MRSGIMQPYFFPYLGYYSLIRNTDRFILLDGVQYIRHGWINRNRILKPGGGWQYIIVPLKKKRFGTLIGDMEIGDEENWASQVLRQLNHYKIKAPFYKNTLSLVESCLDIETRSVVELNENILKKTCDYLGMQVNLEVFSKMRLPIPPIERPGDWALEISKALQAREYYNPIGGKEIFEPDRFRRNGINLKFVKNNLQPYKQKRAEFEPGMSIIDVLMFNDIETTLHLIDNISVEELGDSELPCCRTG